ncbi:MAG: DUF6544 family protein [Bacteroidales bacterium]|nr:DUF6544 family protein [Bacteroidales bacterium]
MKSIIVILIFVSFINGNLSNAENMIFKSQKHPEVETLFASAHNYENKTFTPSLVENLPHPVKEYFLHVLPKGQPYIKSVRLKHDGRFKTGVGKSWTSIAGEQYFTTSKPGFVWIGKTSTFTAKDFYINNQGRLIVRLFSLFKVVDEKGPHIDQGELLRWLGESVWFPTNLLPSYNLSLEPPSHFCCFSLSSFSKLNNPGWLFSLNMSYVI